MTKKQKALRSQIAFLEGQYSEIQKARDVAWVKKHIGKCYTSMGRGTNFFEFMIITKVTTGGEAVVWQNYWASTLPSERWIKVSELKKMIQSSRPSDITEIKKRFNKCCANISDNFNKMLSVL